MVAEQYQAFKAWLIENNKTPASLGQNKQMRRETVTSDFDFIGMLFSINRFIDRFISCGENLFALIARKDYATIYRFRCHYRNKRSPNQDLLLVLCFEYLGYKFEAYEEYEATTSLAKRPNSNILYIHQGNIACLKYKHPIEDVKAAIVTDSDNPLFVHASRCVKCNIAFIRKEEYIRLRNQHPFLVANFCELSYDGYMPLRTGTLADESPLMFCGYSVKSDGLSDRCRHTLLKNIIYNGILSKTDVIQYLEHFIGFNGGKENMFAAVNKWEKDLKFVRSIDIESYPAISITEIRPYSQKGK